MAQQKKKTVHAPIRCACGREELLTPAPPKATDAGGDDQPAQDERPGPQPLETAIAAGPAKPNEEKH